MESSVGTMEAPLLTLSSTSPPFTKKRIRRFALAVYRHLSGISVSRDWAVVDRGIRGNWDDTRLKTHQVDIAATIQRHGGHLLVVMTSPSCVLLVSTWAALALTSPSR